MIHRLRDILPLRIRWMGWTISRTTSRETGIPKGLPYLTGFVTHFAIEAEQAD